MAIGIIISILIGAIIGVYSKNQMMATSISVPTMMVFSFLPMLSLFNPTIKKIGRFAYSQQIHQLIEELSSFSVTLESFLVVLITILILIVLFVITYMKRGMK